MCDITLITARDKIDIFNKKKLTTLHNQIALEIRH